MRCHFQLGSEFEWVHEMPALQNQPSKGMKKQVIDNQGHQYHDGMEGTNASFAEAKVVKENKTDDYAIVTSDATQAYQLVNENVENVNRTFLTIPEMKLILVVDCLMTKEQPANFKARWFVDNEDKNGKIKVDGKKFTFLRPQARLVGVCDSDHEVQLISDTFPVPEEHGVFPFMDVEARKPGNKVVIASAFAALKWDDNEPVIKMKRDAENWIVNAEINGKKMKIDISTKDIYPDVFIS